MEQTTNMEGDFQSIVQWAAATQIVVEDRLT